MDIYETIGNTRQITEKNSGYTYKITHIAAARCPKISNSIQLMLYPVFQCVYIYTLFYI